MSLTIIIPCRNEQKVIGETINIILKYITDKVNEFEIIIINDFSTDNTLEELNKLAKTNIKIKSSNTMNKSILKINNRKKIR
jgi:glycosyltransferase involved in cell wall biosynthesis